MSRRERKLAESRTQVQSEAFRLFAARGFDAVTVDEVADAADVARRTVHRYFPVKADLVLGTLPESKTLLAPLLDSIPDSGPLATAVLTVVRQLTERWPYSRSESATRATIIAGSEELRARDLAKRAAVAALLRDTLERRHPGDQDRERTLWSQLAVSVFFIAHDRWIAEGGALVDHFDRVVQEIRAGMDGVKDGRA